MATSGGRVPHGARRGAPARPVLSPRLGLLAAAAIAALAAWGVLVWTAIGFGRSARGGEGQAWWWLACASVGAVACLCGCLLLVTAALRSVGVLAQRGPRRH